MSAVGRVCGLVTTVAIAALLLSSRTKRMARNAKSVEHEDEIAERLDIVWCNRHEVF